MEFENIFFICLASDKQARFCQKINDRLLPMSCNFRFFRLSCCNFSDIFGVGNISENIVVFEVTTIALAASNIRRKKFERFVRFSLINLAEEFKAKRLRES